MKLMPPADATDFLNVSYRASSIKSGHKYAKAHLINRESGTKGAGVNIEKGKQQV